MQKEYDMSNPNDIEEHTIDMKAQVMESYKTQLLEQGQKYYCPNCSTIESFISSDEQEICPECNNNLVSLDNLA